VDREPDQVPERSQRKSFRQPRASTEMAQEMEPLAQRQTVAAETHAEELDSTRTRSFHRLRLSEVVEEENPSPAADAATKEAALEVPSTWARQSHHQATTETPPEMGS
jgi:hypothetical protein